MPSPQLQGRCQFTQTVKRKPDPVGLKIDCLCEPNGYVHNALIASRDPLKYDHLRGRIPAICYDLLTSGTLHT